MNKKSVFRLYTGSHMPVIGLGTWGMKNSAETVAMALGMGYSMIDTSGDYGTQAGVGEGIERSGLVREDVYIVSKVEETDDAYVASRKNVDELGVEYVDLMLIHRPPHDGAGIELWNGLIRARSEGLAIDIGVSNYSVEDMTTLIEATGIKPVVNQIEWTPFGWDEAMLEFCLTNNIAVQAYSPLTHGKRLNDERLHNIARQYGKTPAQILLRWDLQQAVIPLPKANSTQHLEENLDIFDFEIATQDMQTLNAMNEQYSALGGRIAYV